MRYPMPKRHHMQRGPSQTITNWGGCTFAAESGPVTSISATFTIPSFSGDGGATGGSLISIWVGMGNVLQTGVYCEYDTSYSGNVGPYLSPWTWWLFGTDSNGSEIWDQSAFPTASGDVMTCSMSYSGSYWTVEQTNATKDWSWTEYKSFQSVGTCITAWPYPLNDGCVIIEYENGGASGVTLPDYGTVTFTDISMTPAINTSSINYITTANVHTNQTPGTFSDGSFTMTWNNYT